MLWFLIILLATVVVTTAAVFVLFYLLQEKLFVPATKSVTLAISHFLSPILLKVANSLCWLFQRALLNQALIISYNPKASAELSCYLARVIDSNTQVNLRLDKMILVNASTQLLALASNPNDPDVRRATLSLKF